MTYRLVFETTADKRRFVDLAGEEYPSKILDELESAATSGGVVSVPPRGLLSISIRVPPCGGRWLRLTTDSGMAAARTEGYSPVRCMLMLISWSSCLAMAFRASIRSLADWG